MLRILPRIFRALRLGVFPSGKTTAYGITLFGPPLDGTFHMIARESYGDFVMTSLKSASSQCHFLDIGANVGLFSNALYDHFEGKVSSFEPNVRTFGYLQKNLLANKSKKARAWCAGIYDSADVSATLNHKNFHSGASSMRTDFNVDATRISLLSSADLAVMFDEKLRFCVKIDVEGVEENVVRALKQSNLLSRVDVLVVEMSENTNSRESLKAIREILTAEGLSLNAREGSKTHADEFYVR